MSTAIYYFSGTGNSLHVARELKRRMPEAELIPIIRLLHNEIDKTYADTVGLVFPNFCLTIPIPVHDFLEKVDLGSAQYIFAVCTRGGSPSHAFDYINELLRRQGKRLNAQVNITMPWNHPLGKENLPGTGNEDRFRQLEADLQSKIDRLSEHVFAHDDYVVADTDADLELTRWVKAMNSLIPKSWNYESHRFMYQDLIRFYSDANCTGCGICEQVCLSNKIEMVDDRPVWQEAIKCYGCFACINYCPRQAIQIRSRPPFFESYTVVNARYHHRSITYRDIAEQRA
jgi:ferredoxin